LPLAKPHISEALIDFAIVQVCIWFATHRQLSLWAILAADGPQSASFCHALRPFGQWAISDGRSKRTKDL
jgi:hypothetical protein